MATDPRQVLEVLRAGRALIADPRRWTRRTFSRDVNGIDTRVAGCFDGRGVSFCAVGAIGRVTRDENLYRHPAVRALQDAAWTLGYGTVEAANDGNHADAMRVYDHAIATLEAGIVAAEPTPNADAALEVIGACEMAGEIVARHIVAEHPEMDLREITEVASAELFYMAQGVASEVVLGVKVEWGG